MRRILRPLLAVLASLTVAGAWAAPPARGRGPLSGLPVLSAASVLRPGAWVQYSIVPQKGQPFVLRLAALEREEGAQWVELGITDGMRRTLLLKLLIEGPLVAPKRVRRAIVQPHGQQPFYLPEKLAAAQVPAFREGAGASARRVARVRVTVPAGSFLAEHFRSREKGRNVEAWFSTEIAGWPLLKLSTPELLLELVAHGDKGTSQVRGKPAKISEELWRGLGGQP